MPWQERAFAYYDMIGELHFASQFYARPLSRLKLGVGYKNPEDEVVEPILNGPPVDLLDRVQDPGGGRTVMLSTYGQLMFIAGECFMLNTVAPEEEGGEERWEIVSTDELKYDQSASTFTRRRIPSSRGEEYKASQDDEYEPVDDEAIVYRLWKRHPHYSAWADSPMRAVLDVAEELVMLTLAVRARARSRLAQSGILYVPNELSPQPVAAIGDEDPEEDIFLNDLTTHFVTPIEDEGTAAAVVPFVVRGPAKIGDVTAKDALFHLSDARPDGDVPRGRASAGGREADGARPRHAPGGAARDDRREPLDGVAGRGSDLAVASRAHRPAVRGRPDRDRSCDRPRSTPDSTGPRNSW